MLGAYDLQVADVSAALEYKFEHKVPAPVVVSAAN
jgi:hypothetical protein